MTSMRWYARQLKLFFTRPISVVDCWVEEDEDVVRWCFQPRYFWQPEHPKAEARLGLRKPSWKRGAA